MLATRQRVARVKQRVEVGPAISHTLCATCLPFSTNRGQSELYDKT